MQIIPPVRSSQPYPSSSFLLPTRAAAAPPAARGRLLLLHASVLRPAPRATCYLRRLLLLRAWLLRPDARAAAARILRLLLLRAAPGRRGLLGCAAAAPLRLPACAGSPPPALEPERKGATADFFLKKC